jgi:hypothetical protein
MSTGSLADIGPRRWGNVALRMDSGARECVAPEVLECGMSVASRYGWFRERGDVQRRKCWNAGCPCMCLLLLFAVCLWLLVRVVVAVYNEGHRPP